jgi:chromosome segregation ATPase
MAARIDTNAIHKLASELMFAGESLSVQCIADKLNLEPSEELGAELKRWWMEQESKVAFRASMNHNQRPDVPEAVYQSVQLIWGNALKDASLELELAAKEDKAASASSIVLEDELYLSKAQLEALEDSNQRMRVQLSEHQHNVKNLEAEKAMLRSKLKALETNVSGLEYKVAEYQGEMKRAQSSSDEAKKQLDTRMREEMSRHQVSISKVESKVSYYRHQLDKLRDEWGKKETALNSQLQDLQGEVARSTVTHDTQFSQIRSQDEELRRYRGEITNQSRNMSKSTTQALASSNRLKRLEDELQQREFDIKELKKRTIVDKADTIRRESDLRSLLKSRDNENSDVNGQLNRLQRTLIARDEEIRRLTAKL